MTKNEIQLLAMGIITKIERRGGNFDLRPKVHKDGIAVDYTTDCDRAGNVLEAMERTPPRPLAQRHLLAIPEDPLVADVQEPGGDVQEPGGRALIPTWSPALAPSISAALPAFSATAMFP